MDAKSEQFTVLFLHFASTSHEVDGVTYHVTLITCSFTRNYVISQHILLFVDFPLIINQINEVNERTVMVTWKQGFCPVDTYTVYYREVMSGINGSRWRAVNVSQFANHYNLKLKCYKEYEITVAAWSGETPLKQRKLWKCKTRGGNYSQIFIEYLPGHFAFNRSPIIVIIIAARTTDHPS